MHDQYPEGGYVLEDMNFIILGNGHYSFSKSFDESDPRIAEVPDLMVIRLSDRMIFKKGIEYNGVVEWVEGFPLPDGFDSDEVYQQKKAKKEPTLVALIDVLTEFAKLITPGRMLMNTKEVSEILGVSDSRARRMQDNGLLSLCKLPDGNRRKFIKEEVYQLAAERMLKKFSIDPQVNLRREAHTKK